MSSMPSAPSASSNTQFAVDIANDYFDLLRLKDTVRNNYTNYLRRVDSTQYLEARAVDRVRASEVRTEHVTG